MIARRRSESAGDSPISPTSMMTSGARLMTVSIEIRGILELSCRAPFTPAGEGRKVVQVRAAADGDDVGERAGAAPDDDQDLASAGVPPRPP